MFFCTLTIYFKYSVGLAKSEILAYSGSVKQDSYSLVLAIMTVLVTVRCQLEFPNF